MLIRRLDISGIRNLLPVILDDIGSVNIFFGLNGAGKTSVLESVHMLSSARSFRSHKLNPLINNSQDKCVVYGEIRVGLDGYQPVGVERFKARGSGRSGTIKVAGQTVGSAAVLAENLPVQVISSDTFKLLEGAPIVRRQFIDWGVFHVEQSFHSVWKKVQRGLKQRNSLLRHGRIDDQQLQAWTLDIVKYSENLDRLRQTYFDNFLPVFEDLLKRLVDLPDLSISYYRGWDKDRDLAEIYNESAPREIEKGYTIVGPHRADLKIKYKSMVAAEVLSRGQQKLVVCAMRVSQGLLLSRITGKKCVFLVDDLPSELDHNHRAALCGLLEEIECQVFLTCVDWKDVVSYWSPENKVKVFHVEHGKISSDNRSIR